MPRNEGPTAAAWAVPIVPLLLPKSVLAVCEDDVVSPRDEVHAQEGNMNEQEVVERMSVPCFRTCIGAVAMLDLSGYTKLTELLFGDSESIGGELVHRTVNPFFGALIDTIHNFGGDIVKFCGDAIIVSWTQAELDSSTGEQDTDISLSLLGTVVTCMIHLLSRYDGYRVNLPQQDGSTSGRVNRTYEMGLHMGIGFGTVTHTFVGIPGGRLEHLILGRAVEEATVMLKEVIGEEGQMALSERAWTALRKKSDFSIGDWKVENEKIFFADKSSKKIEPFLAFTSNAYSFAPVKLRMRVEGTPENFIDESAMFRLSSLAPEAFRGDAWQRSFNELRRITTVFVRIANFVMGEEPFRAVYLIQRAFDLIWKPLEKYKGRLRQIVFDDKGLTFFLVWGLPPANALDEVLAHFCALAIRDALFASRTIAFAIGLSRGTAFTGIIGNQHRLDFNFFGKSINIAARCMANPAASGQILCDMASIDTRTISTGGLVFDRGRWEQLKGVIGVTELGILKEGLKDPLGGLGPRRIGTDHGNGVRASVLNDGGGAFHMIGREGEKETVQEAVEKWVDRMKEGPQKQSGGLLIFGKSGCGKTTMLKYAESLLKEQEGQIFFW
ncbi:Adenylate cyclase type 10 [Phlyctochytrium bullatum]|nr:Adenylate cyclase type 10 [Phlyctochytrium bullatum]